MSDWSPLPAGSSQVWRRDDVVRKTYRSHRAWAQAVRALTHGVGPALLRTDEASRTVWMAYVPDADTPTDWVALGRRVRQLHRLPIEPDPLPLGEALARRATAAQSRAHRAGLNPALLDRLVPCLAPLRHTHQTRVWCHRDLTPDNWRMTASGPVLLDLEHARPDHPLADWVKLAARPWPTRAAFERGYGGCPDPERLPALVALHGLQTWTWATTHGDAVLASHGWAILEQAIADGP